jgi:uncharacterized protein YacL
MATRPDHPLDAARDKRRIMIRLVRMAFFILITTVSLVTFLQRVSDQGADQPPLSPTIRTPGAVATDRQPPSVSAPSFMDDDQGRWWVPVAIALTLFGLVLLVDVATPNKKIASISAVMFGLLAGILLTVAISAVIELALRVWLPDSALKAVQPMINIIKPLLGIALCYLGITTILQTQDDFRLVIPYVEFAKQIRGTKPMLLDSSALIDARIADVAATALIQAPMIIPRFVVAELQLLADSNDKLKRARGRRGLDVVTRLQRQGTLDVSIDETPVTSMAVDQALVELAKQLTARIVTTDLGLTRVAQIHGVVVVNVHEVAAALKPALIPGQTLAIRLIKAGEHAGQAVGYLDDGTMVVAEAAAHMIGQDAQVLVTSTIQTTAGRMVFARPIDGPLYDSSEARAVAPTQAEPDRSDESAIAAAMAAGEQSGESAGAELTTPMRANTDSEAPTSITPPMTVAPSTSRPGASGGPFPPKTPVRRPPSPRNPRR